MRGPTVGPAIAPLLSQSSDKSLHNRIVLPPDAVNVLDELALGTTPQDFKKAHKLAEMARVAFEAARERFTEHVSLHRCEVRHLRYLSGK